MLFSRLARVWSHSRDRFPLNRSRASRSVRRPVLELEVLEDRTLLSVVHPGQTWTDGHFDENGVPVYTVSVTNDGPDSDIDVTGGNGWADLGPASGSDFHIHVSGSASWSGPAGSLTLTVSQEAGSIDVGSGALTVTAQGDIGALVGGSVSASSVFGNIGRVEADSVEFVAAASGDP